MEVPGDDDVDAAAFLNSPDASSPLMADDPVFDFTGFGFSPSASPTKHHGKEQVPLFNNGSSTVRRNNMNSYQRFLHAEAVDNMDRGNKFGMTTDLFNMVQSVDIDDDNGLGQENQLTHGLVEGGPSQIQASRSSFPMLNASRGPARILFGDQPNQQEQQTNDQTNLSPLMLEKMDRLLTSFEMINMKMIEREAAQAERFNSAMDILSKLSLNIADLAKKTSAVKKKKTAGSADRATELNWMIGEGTAPKRGKKASPDQVRFDRHKGAARKNALYFLYQATEDFLETWIQFDDEPAASVDGNYILKILKMRTVMSEDWANIVFRLLRYHEDDKIVGEDDNCHYVLHYWAIAVMEGKSSEETRHNHFIKPSFHYDIANCGRVVAMLKLGDVWGSLSIDLKRATTHLIHPDQSANAWQEVLQEYKPMMEILTVEAVNTMKFLVNTQTPDQPWVYDVALKRKHDMHGPESGTRTAYYSIPKSNQFLSVSAETIYLAKLSFIYAGIKYCFSTTKKKVQIGKKPTTSKKRGPDGKPVNDPRRAIYFDINDTEACPPVPEIALDYLL